MAQIHVVGMSAGRFENLGGSNDSGGLITQPATASDPCLRLVKSSEVSCLECSLTGQGGYGVSIVGTGNESGGITIDLTGATNANSGLNIEVGASPSSAIIVYHSGSQSGLYIERSGGAGTGITLTLGGTSTGIGLDVNMTNASNTVAGVDVTHAGSGNGITISKTTTAGGYGLSVSMAAVNTAAGVNVAHAGVGSGLTISKTTTGAGYGLSVTMGASCTSHGIYVANSGSGNGLDITQPSAGYGMLVTGGSPSIGLSNGGIVLGGTFYCGVSSITWTNQSKTPPGVGSYRQPCAYHAARGLMVFVVQSTGQTWTYNPVSNTWTDTGSASPGAYSDGRMCYDSDRQKALLFASYSNTNQHVWEWDGSWTDASNSGPTSNSSTSLCYDSYSKKMICFLPNTGATWEYDPTAKTWAGPYTTGSPPYGRFYAEMEFYPGCLDAEGRSILYGGTDLGSTHYNTTFAYKQSTHTWTQLSPTANPSVGRSYHGMVHDTVRNTIVAAGGFWPSKSDIWSFNGTTWTQLSANLPSDLYRLALVFDTTRGQYLLGGAASWNNTYIGSEGFAGMIDLPSKFEISGSAVSQNVTATNLSTLTGGGNADALHVHSSVPAQSYTAGTGGVSQYDVVYLANDGGNLRAFPATATAEGTARPVGITTTAASAGSTVGVVLGGEYTVHLDATPVVADAGKPVYLDNGGTAGLATLTAPTTSGHVSIRIGYLAEISGTAYCKIVLHVGDPFVIT